MCLYLEKHIIKMYIKKTYNVYETGRVARPRLVVGSIRTFIFPFLRSGVDAKRGVEFRHSARNASTVRRKAENGMS